VRVSKEKKAKVMVKDLPNLARTVSHLNPYVKKVMKLKVVKEKVMKRRKAGERETMKVPRRRPGERETTRTVQRRKRERVRVMRRALRRRKKEMRMTWRGTVTI